jgi:hypothetical protein
LWGTDWTRAFAVVNYEQAVEPFLKTDRLSDTERAMPPASWISPPTVWRIRRLQLPRERQRRTEPVAE